MPKLDKTKDDSNRTPEKQSDYRWPSVAAFEQELVNIYDLYRNALLSKLYYERKLESLQFRNTTSEIILSFGTASFGSMAVWQSAAGKYVFAYLAAISAFLSLLKPILQWPKQISLVSRLLTGYTDLYYDLQSVVQDIGTREGLPAELKRRATQARDRFKKLSLDEPRPNKRIVAECRAEVLEMVPVQSLWLPTKLEASWLDPRPERK